MVISSILQPIILNVHDELFYPFAVFSASQVEERHKELLLLEVTHCNSRVAPYPRKGLLHSLRFLELIQLACQLRTAHDR